MFEERLFPPPPPIDIANYLKGGDFMERQESTYRARYAPVAEIRPGVYAPVREIGSSNIEPGTKNDPRFPKVGGRTRFAYTDPVWRGADEMATATGREEQLNQL